MNKIMYTDSSGISVEMNEYREWHGDEDDGYSVAVRAINVLAPKKEGEDYPLILKRWKYTRVIMKKGRAAQIAEQVTVAKDWIVAYTYQARYPSPIMCNHVRGRHPVSQPCPLLRAGKDGRAKCSIVPFPYGYSGGPDGRDVPTDGVCNLPVETAKMLGDNAQIPGYPLTLYELKECETGIALRKISEAST